MNRKTAGKPAEKSRKFVIHVHWSAVEVMHVCSESAQKALQDALEAVESEMRAGRDGNALVVVRDGENVLLRKAISADDIDYGEVDEHGT